MKEYLKLIEILLLVSVLICSILTLYVSNKTLDYMKYSDYVLNDGLMQQDSLYVYNTENVEEEE